MTKLVKIITADDVQVFPQTAAEGVLVNGNQVETLDKVLKRKLEQIETSENSGLTSTNDGITTTLSHSNQITPNDTPEAKLVQYNQTGHIILTADMNKHFITVNGDIYNQYDGNKETVTAFGDDFKISEDNNIALTWGGIE